MVRIAFPVLVAVGMVAQCAWGVEVAKEVEAIQSAYSETMKQLNAAPPPTADRLEAFNQAVATRTAALEKLAAAAEAAKSTEHAPLARIYLQLGRYDDALRQAQSLLAGGANDAPSHLLLIQAHSYCDDQAAAVAAMVPLFKLDWDEKSAPGYLAATTQAVASVSQQLTAAGKYDVAEKLQNDWQTKLDTFPPETDQFRQHRESAVRALQSLRRQLAAAKARAALIGQPYFPLEEPTWLNGEPISPEQLRGKVVLLDFWAVWCGPCIATFPHLIEWHDRYADKGLVIIGVTQRYKFGWDAESKRGKPVEGLEPAKEDEATTEFAKHHGLKHRLAVMADGSTSQQYVVTGIPQVVVIDQSGIIRFIKVGSGENNAAAIEAEIRKVLGLAEAAGK